MVRVFIANEESSLLHTREHYFDQTMFIHQTHIDHSAWTQIRSLFTVPFHRVKKKNYFLEYRVQRIQLPPNDDKALLRSIKEQKDAPLAVTFLFIAEAGNSVINTYEGFSISPRSPLSPTNGSLVRYSKEIAGRPL